MRSLLFTALVLISMLFPSHSPAAEANISLKLQESLLTFSSIMAEPQKSIPPMLLQKAAGIVIIPNMIKASFFIGAKTGKGVLLVKGRDGSWSNPVFITIKGGSFGLQVGFQSTDLVIVFRRSRALDTRAKGNIILGADASIVAGTLSMKMDENTEPDLKAEIYSFSHSKGLNAGFALQGALLRIDDAATAALYGRKSLNAQDIISGKTDITTNEIIKFKEGFLRLVGKGL